MHCPGGLDRSSTCECMPPLILSYQPIRCNVSNLIVISPGLTQALSVIQSQHCRYIDRRYKVFSHMPILSPLVTKNAMATENLNKNNPDPTGILNRLFQACTSLSGRVTSLQGQDQTLSISQRDRFAWIAQSLMLWGMDLDIAAGWLDAKLDESRDLRNLTVTLLRSILGQNSGIAFSHLSLQ